MYLNLASDDKKSAVSFDFTKFFSEKGHYEWNPFDEKEEFIRREASQYKQLMKNLVEKYISEDKLYELGIYSPVEVVDHWFREALKEELEIPQKEFLKKNYEIFRKIYHLGGEEKDKFIEKLNKISKPIKAKQVCWRLILGECACLVTSYYIVVYDKSEGLVEWDVSENKEINDKDKKVNSVLTRIYEPTVNESEFVFDVSVKRLRMLSKGLDATVKDHYLQVKEDFYNFSLINTYLNDKELVEVWKYHDMILLRQSDRDIILMRTKGSKEGYEVIRLEDYKE